MYRNSGGNPYEELPKKKSSSGRFSEIHVPHRHSASFGAENRYRPSYRFTLGHSMITSHYLEAKYVYQLEAVAKVDFVNSKTYEFIVAVRFDQLR